MCRDDVPGVGANRAEEVILFPGFLRILVRCFCEQQVDPEDAEFDHLRPLQCIEELIDRAVYKEERRVEHNVDDIQDELELTKKQIDVVERKTVRELDVYCGPVLCATLQDRPGYITLASSWGADASRRGRGARPLPAASADDATGGTRESRRQMQVTKKKHKFLSCVIHDTNTESALLMHIEVADSFDHLFSRLTSDHFDVAASADPATRKPTGRCWHVHGGRRCEKLGAMWDYGGHFANHHWQPQDLDANHESIR